jgi:hypothetical protein
VGLGGVYARGGAADLEPRLPMDPPPPARAQATAWKAPALRNNRAKRIKKPFSQFLAIMFFPPVRVANVQSVPFTELSNRRGPVIFGSN